VDLWDRLKLEVKRNNTDQRSAAVSAGIPFGSFQRWLAMKTMPNADQLYSLAKVLNTTVEELLDGENGRDYLLNRAANSGTTFRAPERIADLVDALMQAPDEALDLLRPSILAAAAPRRSQSKLA
jgi:transcriptional regulator with XRE-family HTH domain